MAASSFNAGKWAGYLSPESAGALQGSSPAAATSTPLAGFGANNLFGQGDYESFQKFFQGVPEKDREGFMNFLTVKSLMAPSLMQFDPAWQEKQLELADKYQTKKGWKSLAFNTMTSGLENLTRGIAMSFNPYGTPEAARYSADMLAGAGDRMAAAYAAARTPMAIPAVQAAQAPTYF